METGAPKRGGVRHLGKIPKKSRFFLGGVPNIYLFLIFEYPCSAEEIVYDLRIKTIKTLLINNGKIRESDIQKYKSKAQTLTSLFK